MITVLLSSISNIYCGAVAINQIKSYPSVRSLSGFVRNPEKRNICMKQESKCAVGEVQALLTPGGEESLPELWCTFLWMDLAS